MTSSGLVDVRIGNTGGVLLSVLYICTGNVCRSPMAELLLRAWVGPDEDIAISSAGMRALVGRGIDRSSASALGQLGIDPSRHLARQFEPWMAADADLILTAERAHRDQVMTELPSVFRRAFTMKEFARLARHVGSGNAQQVIAAAADIRGIDGPVPVEVDDMPDPFGGRIPQAAAIAAQVTDTVHPIVGMLGMAARRHAMPRQAAAAGTADVLVAGARSRRRPR